MGHLPDHPCSAFQQIEKHQSESNIPSSTRARLFRDHPKSRSILRHSFLFFDATMSGSGDDVSVQQLFAEKWRNFTGMTRHMTIGVYPRIFDQLATLPDNADDALVLLAAYLVPMRIFVQTRAERELLELLQSFDEELAEEAAALCENTNSHTKQKLWRYGAFFLDVVDTLTTQQPKQ